MRFVVKIVAYLHTRALAPMQRSCAINVSACKISLDINVHFISVAKWWQKRLKREKTTDLSSGYNSVSVRVSLLPYSHESVATRFT